MVSNERGREIMAMESMMEEILPGGKRFHNYQHCEYSGICSFEKIRLGFAIVKGQKHCSMNPGRKECGAYEYLSGLESPSGIPSFR